MPAAESIANATALITTMYDAAIVASDPEAAVERHLRRDADTLTLNGESWPVNGRVVVVGAGKAAVAMSRAVERLCGDLIDVGLVITKDGHASAPLPSRIQVVEAGHPIPDERGAGATDRILAALNDLTADDLVIALISGGGSALLELPKPGISLSDMASVTDLLLRAGAPIQDLNTVRRPLSQVKGGGLLHAAGDAPVLSLILSDVLGNDPHVIASGPTVPSPTTARDALEVLQSYGVLKDVPASVQALVERDDEPLATAGPVTTGSYAIVADNKTAIDAAVAAALGAGRDASVIWRDVEGEASVLGTRWVLACQKVDAAFDVLIGGGEATVTVRGEGVGGRNTEFALAAAIDLASAPDPGWVVASLATDGQDGPTGAAGAIADAATVRRATDAGIDPVQTLAENDSIRVFKAAGGLVSPGPTGTNVNDLYFAVSVSGR